MEKIDYLTQNDLTFVWLWLGLITIALVILAFIVGLQALGEARNDRAIQGLREDIERNYDFDQYRDTRINSLQDQKK